MVSFVQPYTKDDLERGEEIVQALHGVKGYDAWAELIAKALSAERHRRAQALESHMPDVRCQVTYQNAAAIVRGQP